MFCHFDGCNNDPEYPFTHYATRREWEAQQREYEEMDRAFEEKRKLREAGLLPDEDLFSDVAGTSTSWKTSFSAPKRSTKVLCCACSASPAISASW